MITTTKVSMIRIISATIISANMSENHADPPLQHPPPLPPPPDPEMATTAVAVVPSAAFAVITAVPAPIPTTVPSSRTMATEVSEDDQVIVCDDGVTVATIFPVPPTAKDKDVGFSDMTVD